MAISFFFDLTTQRETAPCPLGAPEGVAAGHAGKRIIVWRDLYDKIIDVSSSRHALPTWAAVSFAESSFFPVPPDVLLVPIALAQPHKARLYALDLHHRFSLGRPTRIRHWGVSIRHRGKWLISFYGYGEGVEAFRTAYAAWGA
jgi:membrane protein YqaA with SNARE-associated domain